MEEINQEKEKSLIGKSFFYFFDMLSVVIWALVIIIPIRVFLFQPFFVQGASMQPNFHNGEYLIVGEWGYKQTQLKLGEKEIFTVKPTKEFSRGDVIVFKYPLNPKEIFIKRVIGLPGEKIEINEGKIKISNEKYPEGFFLDEKGYIPSMTKTTCEDYCDFNLSQNEYIVMGDNRSHSSDSRYWGVLPKENVIGKVFVRAWPVGEFDFFME